MLVKLKKENLAHKNILKYSFFILFFFFVKYSSGKIKLQKVKIYSKTSKQQSEMLNTNPKKFRKRKISIVEKLHKTKKKNFNFFLEIFSNPEIREACSEQL